MTEENQINVPNETNKQYSVKELMIIHTINRVKNPFRNLTVQDVSKDLNIGINSAYELFKRDDFPSIEIGKKKVISLLAYLAWKMDKHI